MFILAPLKTLFAASLIAILTSCGGGGGSSGSEQGNASGGSGTSAPGDSPASGNGSGGTGSGSSDGSDAGGNSSDGGSGGGDTGSGSGSSDGDSTGSGGDTDSGNAGSDGETPSAPPTPFAASVAQAPADGATISGTVRIVIDGSGIENVELLPATGYSPLYARGVVNGDRQGAYIDLNTEVLEDGEFTMRVATFSAPPGEGGSEIAAMPARTWTIQNGSAPDFSAQLVTAPPDNLFWLGSRPDGTSSGTERFEVGGTGLGNVELVSAKDSSVKYGTFTISPDRTRAVFDWEYAMYEGWAYGSYEVRILAWDVPPGEAGREIEVMAPRKYWNNLPRSCQGEGTCGGEAP